MYEEIISFILKRNTTENETPETIDHVNKILKHIEENHKEGITRSLADQYITYIEKYWFNIKSEWGIWAIFKTKKGLHVVWNIIQDWEGRYIIWSDGLDYGYIWESDKKLILFK